MKKSIILVAAVFVGCFLLVGCTFNNEKPNEANNNSEETDPAAESNNENEDPNAANSDSDEKEQENNSSNDNEASLGESAEPNLPEPIEIDEEIEHPNGTTLQVEEVRFNEDYISINFNAAVGQAEDGIYLAEDSHKGGLTLEDDEGNDYSFMPYSKDYSLYLATNEVMEGTLKFAGKIDEDASSLTLTFNPEYSDSDKDEQNPKFEFEIDLD